MLIIRNEQFKPFQEQAEKTFELEVAEILRNSFPKVIVQFLNTESEIDKIPDDILLQMIRNGIARGRSYGLELKSSLTKFVTLMFLIAPNYDRQEAIKKFLETSDLPPNDRPDALSEAISENDWFEARKSYDETAWTLEKMEMIDGH